MEKEWQVPLSFMFEVSFSGPRDIATEAFAEVSGLSAKIDTESVVEGGENGFVHQLPKQVKQGPLKLKRQLGAKGDGLTDWCQDTLEGGLTKPIELMDLVIKALDREQNVLRSWDIKGAYPTSWTMDAFDAAKSALTLENVELAYQTVKES